MQHVVEDGGGHVGVRRHQLELKNEEGGELVRNRMYIYGLTWIVFLAIKQRCELTNTAPWLEFTHEASLKSFLISIRGYTTWRERERVNVITVSVLGGKSFFCTYTYAYYAPVLTTLRAQIRVGIRKGGHSDVRVRGRDRAGDRTRLFIVRNPHTCKELRSKKARKRASTPTYIVRIDRAIARVIDVDWEGKN